VRRRGPGRGAIPTRHQSCPLQFEAMKVELKVVFDEIRGLLETIAGLDNAITENGSNLGCHKGLPCIKGIGPVTGSLRWR
jgi:hypothetical protein